MYKEHTATIGQKSMLQRSSSIKIIEEEETQFCHQVQLDQERAEP